MPESPPPGNAPPATLLRGKLCFWLIAVLGVAVDLWGESAAFAWHAVHQGAHGTGQPLEVWAGGPASLWLVREYNAGIAFGLFGDAAWSPLLFGGLRAAAVAVLLWMLWRTSPHARAQQGCCAALAAGAAGNLWDNLFHWEAGHEHTVRDFLCVCFGRGGAWCLPAFNAADALVAVGGGGLLALAIARGWRRVRR